MTSKHPSRSSLVRARRLFVLAMVFACGASWSARAATPPSHGAGPAISPSPAWQQLEARNRRFAAGTPQHPHQSKTRRADEAKGQHPIAVVLGCSDSRVPPELVFDEGIGDLFVVRTAGHRLDD